MRIQDVYFSRMEKHRYDVVPLNLQWGHNVISFEALRAITNHIHIAKVLGHVFSKSQWIMFCISSWTKQYDTKSIKYFWWTSSSFYYWKHLLFSNINSTQNNIATNLESDHIWTTHCITFNSHDERWYCFVRGGCLRWWIVQGRHNIRLWNKYEIV